MRLLVAATLLAGCGVSAPVPAARWPTSALLDGAREHESYAGFPAGFFVTLAGQPMPFRGPDYQSPPALAAEDGWSVLPAFARAQPAAYIVSEVWAHHPDPWTQPIYVPVASFEPLQPQRVGGTAVPNTLGVGNDSTFYSPFWVAFFFTTRSPAPADGFPDTRAVLDASTQTSQLGISPLCPVTPFPFGLASVAADPQRPLTSDPLRARAAAPTRVDGATAAYIDFGPGRFKATPGGRLLPSRIFFFTQVVDEKVKVLELPAVLSDDAVHSAYARRFDVALGDAVVFVPAGAQWDTVRSRLAAPPVDPGIPAALAASYALRVAKSSTCFAIAADFPGGCEWLDSEAAIDLLGPGRVTRTEVTMTAVPLWFAGAQP